MYEQEIEQHVTSKKKQVHHREKVGDIKQYSDCKSDLTQKRKGHIQQETKEEEICW